MSFRVYISILLACIITACGQASSDTPVKVPDTSNFPQTTGELAAKDRIASELKGPLFIEDIATPFIEICQHLENFELITASLNNNGWMQSDEDQVHNDLKGIISNDVYTAPTNELEIETAVYEKNIDKKTAYIYFVAYEHKDGEKFNECSFFDFSIPKSEVLGQTEGQITEWTNVSYNGMAHVEGKFYGGNWNNVKVLPGIGSVTAHASTQGTSGTLTQGRRITAFTNAIEY